MTSSNLEENMAYLGVSPPISRQEPTLLDMRDTNDLIHYLKSCNIFDTDEGKRKRSSVIDRLLIVVRQWVRVVGMSRHVAEHIFLGGGNVQLRIFGSQRLGVNTPDADIDVLCLAPAFVSSADFFSSFCQILSGHPDVSMLFPVPRAYTPVLKFNFDGQAIDMIFVSLCENNLPENLDVLDTKWLKYLDEQGVRSLNGSRVAEIVLRLIPNIDSFQVALRAIKHWARQRGLYSNVLGFLGGVNFAILVAFICQRYTNAAPSTLIEMFFMIFSRWSFRHPVMLTGNTLPSQNEDFESTFLSSSWNPLLNPRDASHLMPIITPAYPFMNSAYNVGSPQFIRIKVSLLFFLNLIVLFNGVCCYTGRARESMSNLYRQKPRS